MARSESQAPCQLLVTGGAGFIGSNLHQMIKAGHIRIVDPNVRPYAYRLTPDGERYRRRVSHAHYRSVLRSFRDVERRITSRLKDLRRRGAHRVVFYGSGEVVEITYPLAMALGLKVIGPVDDDSTKHGTTKAELSVQPPSRISDLQPDAVVITTFRHAEEIRKKIDRPIGPRS